MSSTKGTFTVETGRPIDLTTDRFRLRSLKPVDASERWLGWSKDPEVMHPGNAPVRHLTRAQLAQYIGSHDNYTRYLIGVFDKASGIQIGFYFIDVDRLNDTATFNVIIGEKDWWGKSVVNETRAVLLDHFFEQLGIAKACGGPLSRNFPAIFNYKAQGWFYEGTLRGQFRSVADGSRLDQLRFRLFPDEWRALRGKGQSK
jgi:[ribosomal protein S5]-alanine N-acetyltransferase